MLLWVTEEWSREGRGMTLNLTFTGMGNLNGSVLGDLMARESDREKGEEAVIIFLSEAKVSYVGRHRSPMTPLMNARRRHCKHYKYYKFVDLLTGCQKSHSHQELLVVWMGGASFQCKSITVGRIVLHATGNGRDGLLSQSQSV